MSKVVIIGAGGVGNVVAQKCAQLPDIFTEIVLASRTIAKCEAIAVDVMAKTGVTILTVALDADNVDETIKFLNLEKPELLINVALPYQDLALMDACLDAGVHYMDTANYEPPEEAKFEYKWQWAYQDRFKKEPQEVLKRPGVLAQFCDPPIVFSNEGTVGSSFDAHRLSLWARECGGQEGQLGLMEYFFRSHWTDGLNIGDNAVLLDSVSRAGLDVGAAETVLKSSEYGEEVERQSRGRLTTACGGVPCFLFGGETTLSGPVPTGDIVREIKACLEEKNDPFAQ